MDGGTDFCDDVDIWFEGCLSIPLPFSLDYCCISDSEFVLFGSMSRVLTSLSFLFVFSFLFVCLFVCFFVFFGDS